ncbi:NmrA family NAD(P)-binding protein [Acidicapsa acidisoli]|uniref:NmrA family NAD(P)-binding protein n=1 Tax=Acidicapsa acidisoli TaxID=1615681 RepID=UPI0021DF553E|nr:NmrA family NAD(P)-binding protein [Acidicapsa acidisoli]
MYAVMGITGKVGGAVARTLLAKGEKVRGIVRNPEKAEEWQRRGVGLFKADYDDVDALTTAFTGVAGVFVMVPPNFAPAPGFAETKATLKVLHEALSRSLPSKAVYLSSIGAEQASGLGLITSSHLLEETLSDLPFSHAFLRAGWFIENSAGDLPSARNECKIRFQLHPLDRKFPLVATADIGKVGAQTLTQSWTGIRHIEVAGPEGYSPLDITNASAEAVGRPVEAIAVPRAEWETLWVSQGMPEGRTAPRAEMVDGFNSGWIHFGVPGTEHVNGATPLREVIAQLVNRG